MKNNFLRNLETVSNYGLTENGALSNNSTWSYLLDAFGSLGAMRKSSEQEIISLFNSAWEENPKMAARMLFYFRDCRGDVGQGERRLFRVILNNLAFSNPKFVKENIKNIPYYGRWDDLLCLFNTPVENFVVSFIKTTLLNDFNTVNKGGYPETYCAKWMPSENTSSKETKELARQLYSKIGWKPSVYRKILSKIRKSIYIVETLMSSNNWDKIEYEKIPSKAALNYAMAFFKHTPEAYKEYISDVSNGKNKLNSKVLNPVDVIKKVENFYFNDKNKLGKKEFNEFILDTFWNNLPNYFEGLEENGIVVADVSGSMYWEPIQVAASLAIYCAERCNGVFKDKFITFSEVPTLESVTGKNIVEKYFNLANANWGYSTNLQAVFNLILNSAIKGNCKQEDLPSKIYIISDMQVNRAVKEIQKNSDYLDTFMETITKEYNQAGYTVPNLVYWNVRASNGAKFLQTKNDNGCCFISGYSPTAFKNVIQGTEIEESVNEKGENLIKEKLDPIHDMMNTLNNERYDNVIMP